MSDRLKTFIRQRAAELGFDVCRFASAVDAWPAGERLRAFVGDGRHGEMEWMETTLDRRAHPTAMWDGARTAVVLGMNYGPDQDPLPELADRSAGYISVYARGDDYHEVIKGRLKILAGQMAARLGADVKVFVDTAPLMEKPLAQRAGLGWQGKHTNLLSRTHGNWLFLGTILTAAGIEPDAPETEHCGRCTACLDACPTKAFPAPFQLDARRCLSYLTIEYAGPWPEEFRTATGSRIYGCDDCLAVCPWNKFAQGSREIRLQARETLTGPRLADLVALDDAAFRALFAKSPVKRIGRDRFIRNVLYAIGNSADPALIAPARALLDDPSPVVRDAAVWALSRLMAAAEFASYPISDGKSLSDPSPGLATG
ncbi:tRNA epoxyqueuosine(34) reductase QueG [Brevundimonas sp.]|uniref:tRNA epoxyqueuosine(34) reductase QueG n=1 Tax=Brevundimonas sp. TaxID=1871086 RepID=UPI0019B8B4A0|nr:tRNA epoxyqueuosine(34) reductase QueG [Brevundimonas sp.]MBD3835852.1 tRNA epoxyqueuosine(34) reductase QueG [Brevundimonas sp.]